jgi:hypothetical protein
MSGVRNLLAEKPVGKVRVDLSSTNIDTSNWTTLFTAPAACNAVSIAYSGEGILKLAKGSVGNEVELPLYLTPGQAQEFLIPLELAKSLRISGKCIDQAVMTGELVINFYG